MGKTSEPMKLTTIRPPDPSEINHLAYTVQFWVRPRKVLIMGVPRGAVPYFMQARGDDCGHILGWIAFMIMVRFVDSTSHDKLLPYGGAPKC